MQPTTQGPENRHSRNPAGKKQWQGVVIKSILTNEKYKGDARLQKRFTTDYLTKKMKINEGEVAQYYVAGSHPAIIEPGAWDQVQKEFYRRKETPGQRRCTGPFSGKLLCSDCGRIYGSKVWHSTDRYRRVVWQCNGKFKEKCRTPHWTEERIKDAFLQALSILLSDREQLIEDGRLIRNALTDCSGVDEKMREIEQELAVVVGLIERCVQENATIEQDQEAYDKRYNALTDRYEGLTKKKSALQKERRDREAKADALSGFLFELGEHDRLDMEFSPQQWNAIVDHVTILHDGWLVFRFRNGSEITVEL